MRTLLVFLALSLSLFAADRAAAPKVLSDGDARAVRELQLAATQAQLAATQAQHQFEAAKATLEKLQPAIEAKVKELQKKYDCADCGLDQSLNWQKPQEPEKTEKK